MRQQVLVVSVVVPLPIDVVPRPVKLHEQPILRIPVVDAPGSTLCLPFRDRQPVSLGHVAVEQVLEHALQPSQLLRLTE